MARASDVILSAPLSLRRLPAQILAGRPIVIAHPTVLEGSGIQRSTAIAKRAIARRLTNIVPSTFLGHHVPCPIVIPNPFDSALFRWPERPERSRRIVFAGRLIRLKGAHLLIEAFSQVARDAADVTLTIIGEGPEERPLQQLAIEHGIADRIRFTGALQGEALAKEFRRHSIMVVPTESEEAFGIVALEGLASGCRMIVARSGGLPEAVGPHALLFDRGDVAGLAACLNQALREKEPPSRERVERYLDDFAPAKIAARYLEVIENRLRR